MRQDRFSAGVYLQLEDSAPEIEILFALIRIDEDGRERVRALLGAGPDWDVLVQLAGQQGLLPMLYYRAHTEGRDLVPAPVLEDLQRVYLHNAHRNMRLIHWMLRVCDLFSGAGISHIPLKGPTLAERLYGDASLRTYVDLDILIRPADFQRCYELLVGSGCSPKRSLSHREQRWLQRGDTEYEFYHQGDLLELHWQVAEKGVQAPLNAEDFWQDLQVCEFRQRQITLLSAENLFLFLCIHGAKHRWSRLCWLADLAHFVQTYPEFDWLRLLEHARHMGFRRVVCLGLNLVESFCGVDFAPDIRQAFQADPSVKRLTGQAAGLIQGGDGEDGFAWMRFYLGTRERLRDRVRFIIDQVFFPKQVDWVLLTLPGALYPLYYLYRPARLAYKFIPELIGLLLV